VKTNVIPIVHNVPSVPKGLEKKLKPAGTTIGVEMLQKTALFGTANVLRGALESS